MSVVHGGGEVCGLGEEMVSMGELTSGVLMRFLWGLLLVALGVSILDVAGPTVISAVVVRGGEVGSCVDFRDSVLPMPPIGAGK